MLELVTQFTENYLNKKSDRLQKAQTFFATKAMQSIPLRHRFVIDFFGNSSIAFLHRLAGLLLLRLSPQTFCSLRSCVLLLCVGDLLGMALPFLTPHFSLCLHLYSPILSRSHIFIPFEYHGEIRSVLKARFI